MSSIVYTPSPTPTNPSEGEVYYDSTSKELKVYGNSSSFEKIHDETVETVSYTHLRAHET